MVHRMSAPRCDGDGAFHVAMRVATQNAGAILGRPAPAAGMAPWPLHDIAVTNIVRCITYKGAFQVEVGGGKRMIDSHNKALKRNNIL